MAVPQGEETVIELLETTVGASAPFALAILSLGDSVDTLPTKEAVRKVTHRAKMIREILDEIHRIERRMRYENDIE
jgi:hypothetical protein